MAYKNLTFIAYDNEEKGIYIPKLMEELKEKCESWAYIKHDKDMDENGEVKKAHYHIILRFYNEVNKSTIATKFNIHHNLVQALGNLYGSIKYMLHIAEENKHKYDVSELKVHNLDLETILTKIKLNCSSDEQSLIKLIELIKKAQWDYKYNNKKTKYLANTDLLKIVIENGFLDIYKRYYIIIRDLLKDNFY